MGAKRVDICTELHSTVSPIVKCSTGDMIDVNNYTAIAVSKGMSKLLEIILSNFVETDDDTDNYQFGFRKKSFYCFTHSCFYKQTVNCYVQRGSHVFCAFIDFNKAFDNVSYWLLFSKLINKYANMPKYFATRLLAYWYSNQKMFARWQGCVSTSFTMSNGVRQGRGGGG